MISSSITEMYTLTLKLTATRISVPEPGSNTINISKLHNIRHLLKTKMPQQQRRYGIFKNIDTAIPVRIDLYSAVAVFSLYTVHPRG